MKPRPQNKAEIREPKMNEAGRLEGVAFVGTATLWFQLHPMTGPGRPNSSRITLAIDDSPDAVYVYDLFNAAFKSFATKFEPITKRTVKNLVVCTWEVDDKALTKASERIIDTFGTSGPDWVDAIHKSIESQRNG